MKGWVLYKSTANPAKPETYELRRFQEVAGDLGIEIEIIAPERFDLVVTRDDRRGILLDGHEVALPDFLLPRLGAGTTYFALAVIRQLERLGVQTFNSSQSIETVKDKLYTHQILAQSNLPVAKTMLAKFPLDTDAVRRHLGFPVVVKTLSGSQGTGVFLCETERRFEDLMQLIEATRSNVNIIVQEFVSTAPGSDLRVYVVGGRAVACMHRTSLDGSFKANYSRGGHVEAYPLTQEIEWIASETARLLGLDVAGIDLLFDGEHFKICEANSAPGFEGIEACHQISIAHQILGFVAARLGAFEKLPREAREARRPVAVALRESAPEPDATTTKNAAV